MYPSLLSISTPPTSTHTHTQHTHSSTSTSSLNPISTVAAGVLSSAAAAWHTLGEAGDKVLYGTPLGRSLMLPRLYPTPVVHRSTYGTEVQAIAVHNGALCTAAAAAAEEYGQEEDHCKQKTSTDNANKQSTSSDNAHTSTDASNNRTRPPSNPTTRQSPQHVLHVLERIGELPAPCFNPYKNAMPITPRDMHTLYRIPIAYQVLPTGDAMLTGVADERIGEAPRTDWRLRVDIAAMLKHCNYPHERLLVDRGPSMRLMPTGHVVVRAWAGPEGPEEGDAPRGALLVGDLGMYVGGHGAGEDASAQAAGPLVPVLGRGAWWRAPPMLMAPPVPLGMGALPVLGGRDNSKGHTGAFS